jgi:hypothetical protein
MPSPDGGDDFVGIGGRGEGLGHLVGLLDKAVGLEIDDRSEDAAFQSSVARAASPALSRDRTPQRIVARQCLVRLSHMRRLRQR